MSIGYDTKQREDQGNQYQIGEQHTPSGLESYVISLNTAPNAITFLRDPETFAKRALPRPDKLHDFFYADGMKKLEDSAKDVLTELYGLIMEGTDSIGNEGVLSLFADLKKARERYDATVDLIHKGYNSVMFEVYEPLLLYGGGGRTDLDGNSGVDALVEYLNNTCPNGLTAVLQKLYELAPSEKDEVAGKVTKEELAGVMDKNEIPLRDDDPERNECVIGF